jgi:hypothetical protein
LPTLAHAPLAANNRVSDLAAVKPPASIRKNTTLALAARSKRDGKQDIFAGRTILHRGGTMPRRNKVRAPARRFVLATQGTQCAETTGGVNVYLLNGLPLLVGVLALSHGVIYGAGAAALCGAAVPRVP